MGGCSSKPKTAEFEGVMESHEDMPQDEAPRKSLEADKTGVQRSIQTIVTEREQDDLRDIFTDTDKQIIAGLSPEGTFKEERQVLEDDCQLVKQTVAETINEQGSEKSLAVKEEILKLQVYPEVVTHEDPVVLMEVTKTIQETPLLATIKAETVYTQQEPPSLLKGTFKNEKQDVFSESKMLSLKVICISSFEDASKLQVKPMGPQDRQLKLSKNFSVGEILELQKDSEDVALGLQDACTEASSKERVESEYRKSVLKSKEQRLDDGHDGKDNQVGVGSKECGELCKETEAGACEVVNAASGGVMALERGKEVLKDSSKPIWEDEIQGAAFSEAAEELITGTCIVKNSPFAEASDQEPSRGIDSSDAVHPAITTDVSLNNLQHAVDEQDLVQEEQQVDVDAAYKLAMEDLKRQADIHPVNDFLVKESTLDTTHKEGELISAKICMEGKHSLPVTAVSEELFHVQLMLENEVQEEKSRAAVICIEGQRKLDASCTPDEVTASQVIATTKKPEAQSVHVMEFAELAFTRAHDIPAPDIDDVLEKLASEFERQESLARATS